jgi:hypothetical protein
MPWDSEDEEQKRLMKQAIKEGIKEWLNEIYTEFGRWSLKALGALALAALLYFMLKMNGWAKV